MVVLEAKNIIKVYGGSGEDSKTTALNEVDLNIRKGEFVGIMGPSGSGKTTLLNILSGLIKPSQGVINIDNHCINSMSMDEAAHFRRKKIGFVFQDYNLMDSLTLKENMLLPLILDKRPLAEMHLKCENLIKLLDLIDHQNKYPYQMSGGQQQRTCIGRALINKPALVFADEPTGNLDSNSSNNIMSYLDKVNKEQEATILMVTHDPNSASFCDRIIFLKDGMVSMEIYKKSTRIDFLDEILNCLSVMGGVQR